MAKGQSSTTTELNGGVLGGIVEGIVGPAPEGFYGHKTTIENGIFTPNDVGYGKTPEEAEAAASHEHTRTKSWWE
jgi:hypothetical protein